MSITNTTNTVTYSGDGTTTQFPYAYPLQEASDIQVWIIDASGTHFPLNVPTLLSSNYQVDTVNNRVLYPTTGSPLASDGSTITLLRIAPLTQEVVLTDTGPLPVTTLEQALDKLTMLCQQITEAETRTLIYPPGTTSPSIPTLLADILAAGANAIAAAASQAAAAASAAAAANSADIVAAIAFILN